MPAIAFRRKTLNHTPPFWIDVRGARFFITICLGDRRIARLCEGTAPSTILNSMRHYNNMQRWWASVAVVMPDHVHLICSFPEGASISKTVKDWKHWNATQLKINWQTNFFEHRLRNEDQYIEKGEYILENPVRAGLVDRWEKWPHRLIENGQLYGPSREGAACT